MVPRTLHFPDVIVIGAGPVGCATALAFAHRQASVLLVDGDPRSPHRLAGEWLHPPGVQMLERLGVKPAGCSGHPAGQGFAVFPPDGSQPILLQYETGSVGWSCDHLALVTALRESAVSVPNIRFLSHTQVTQIEGQKLRLQTSCGPESTVEAPLIVGADGRSSLARRSLGLVDDRRTVSLMAGMRLDNVELKFEGFGQVILGGPGPVMACRIAPHHIRLFLDVPAARPSAWKNAQFLLDAYGPFLPRFWMPAFRRALATGAVSWAANQRRSRACYGRPGLALVGDAVGCMHPLTAAGMTLGLLDGQCLAQSKTVIDYQRERVAKSWATELLAAALYKVFTAEDDGTRSLRQAVFQMWRESPSECRRTMCLLSGEETKVAQLSRAFLHVLTLALQNLARESVLAGRWRHTGRALKSVAGLLMWLGATMWSGPAERRSAGRFFPKRSGSRARWLDQPARVA